MQLVRRERQVSGEWQAYPNGGLANDGQGSLNPNLTPTRDGMHCVDYECSQGVSMLKKKILSILQRWSLGASERVHVGIRRK